MTIVPLDLFKQQSTEHKFDDSINESLNLENQEYFLFKGSCPECLANGKKSPIDNYVHDKCGSYIYIGDNGKVLCEKCSISEKITNLNILCEHHATSTKTLSTLVPIIGMQVLERGQEWLIKSIKSLEEWKL